MEQLTFDEQEYEALIGEGVAAAKAGYRETAARLLRKAADYQKPDARPWIWLSATTDDPLEKRRYLEFAVSTDPGNSLARRGLVMLSEKLDKARLVPEGKQVEPRRPSEPEDASSQSFICPKCGGRLSFNIQSRLLTCEYCGHSQPADLHPAADSAEQPMDFVLPTTRGHRWAEAQQRLACGRCGAVTLLPAGQKTSQCPYCGSNQLVESTESAELVDPQVIGLMKIDEKQATVKAKSWLGSGLFTPDDLSKRIRQLKLRPAYYPFWTFDGIVEVAWRCEVNHGTSKNPVWVPVNGAEFEMFNDVLVPGVKAIQEEHLAGIEPFLLKDLVEFHAEYLAGWPALNYNRPLAEASLLAREKVIKKVRRMLPHKVEPGKEKRNLKNGEGKWSGLTFKHVLLPIWAGTYEYQGKLYPLLVNGQTGKVGGTKPKDSLKVIMIAAGAVILLSILAAQVLLLAR